MTAWPKSLALGAAAVAAACVALVGFQLSSPEMHWAQLAQVSLGSAAWRTVVVFSELFIVVSLANCLLFNARDHVRLPQGRLARLVVLAVCPRLGLAFDEQVFLGTGLVKPSRHRKLWKLTTVHYHLLPGAALCLMMIKLPMILWVDAWLVQFQSPSLQMVLAFHLTALVAALSLSVCLALRSNTPPNVGREPYWRVPGSRH